MMQQHLYQQNYLLSKFTPVEIERLESYIEWTPLTSGQVLYKDGEPIRHVYFPVNCIVSLLHTSASGAHSEVAMVGNEGIVGINSFIGSKFMPFNAVVLCSGYAFRLPLIQVKQEFDQNKEPCEGTLQSTILDYIRFRLAQIQQLLICNRFHTLEQQVCRWILQILDRTQVYELQLTHELIAQRLGVYRESISQVVGKLQQENLIRASRGRILVMDRESLETKTCECHQFLRYNYPYLTSPVSMNRKQLSAVLYN